MLVFQLDTPGGLIRLCGPWSRRDRLSGASRRLRGPYRSACCVSWSIFNTFRSLCRHGPRNQYWCGPSCRDGRWGNGQSDEEKVENDAAAYIQSIAERRGRNTEWAVDAVRKSVSATAKEALALKLIDSVPESLTKLLEILDGQDITMGSSSMTLHTKNAKVREYPMTWRLEALKALSDPQHRLCTDDHRDDRDYCRIVQPWGHPSWRGRWDQSYFGFSIPCSLFQ